MTNQIDLAIASDCPEFEEGIVLVAREVPMYCKQGKVRSGTLRCEPQYGGGGGAVP